MCINWILKCWMRVLIFSTAFVWNVCDSGKIRARYCHKCPISSCKILVRFYRNLYFLDRLPKNTHIKFYENPVSGSRIVLCGGADEQTDGRTHMTKLIVPSRNSANVPKIGCYCLKYINIYPCLVQYQVSCNRMEQWHNPKLVPLLLILRLSSKI